MSTLNAQVAPSVQLSVSQHEVCLGDVVTLQDNTQRDRIIARQWVFNDTNIYGYALGDQITIYRQFDSAVNPVTLQVVFQMPDTTIVSIIDTITSIRYDTIINAPEDTTFSTIHDTTYSTHYDTTFTTHNDTIQAFDTVYVFLPDKMTLTGDSIACPGDSINIKMEPVINGVSYSWFEHHHDDGFPLAYGSRLRIKPYSNSALYFLKIKNAQGCIAWDSARVYIMQNTLTSMPADGKICMGDSAILIAGKADHYEWNAIPIDTMLGQMQLTGTLVVKPTTSTIYACTPYGTNGCAGETQYVTIEPFEVPIPSIKMSPRFIDPEDPQLHLEDISSNSVSTYWSFGLGETGEGKSITHRFFNLRYDSTEIVMRTSNAIGCYVDTAFRVPIQRFASWAPNIFTPNRAENSTFRIQTINEVEYFSVYIYTREGKLVFESEDPHFVWDGTHKGKDCPQGTYVYICRYRRANTSDVAEMKGVLTLIR
ncbi:MAG: gliding motility-associated C-terminal domain-containing protein [Bacteroidales bacterium]|nr:gliding motility-associated C-terminal domain-containing protein [Bacteroidales bacterium]